jgi:hypothetical protein
MIHVLRLQALPACLGLVLLVVALIASSSGAASARAATIETRTGQKSAFQLLPPGQIPGETYPTPPPGILSPVDDSDGDGIPNIQDPDDDNGGTSDEDDPAPFDPVIEPTPAPDILSPIDDSDGDGMPNIQDPDDDNDAISDDEDAAPFVPGTDDPNPPTKAPPTSTPTPTKNTASSDPPVVTALPVTGTGGPDDGWRMVWTIVITGAAYVGLAALATVRELRVQRREVK